MKPSITILHKLPNRIRVKLSEKINDLDKVKNIIKENSGAEIVRYNNKIDSLLVKFSSDMIDIETIQLRLIIAISRDNALSPVKMFEKKQDQNINHLVFESGLAITAAFIYGVLNPMSGLKMKLEILASTLTVGAVAAHGLSEIKRKGVFDPEVMSVFYLINAMINKNYIKSSAVTWISTFGRHLLNFHRDGKEYKVLKERLKDGESSYHVVVSHEKNVTNLDDIFNNMINKNRDDEKMRVVGNCSINGCRVIRSRRI